MGRVDLDSAERVINRPHVIELRDDGWTIMHPPACHPRLFDCPVNRAAGRNLEERPPQAPGRYFCDFDPDGVDWGFVIGEPVEDAPGIDWAALVAELRVAREENARLKADLGIVGNELERMRQYAEVLRSAIHADDRHVQHLDDPGSGGQ